MKMLQPCRNVSQQKLIKEMLIYNILKKCIYNVIYAYAQNRVYPLYYTYRSVGGQLFSDQGFCSMELVVNSRVPFALPHIAYVLTYVLISISV